WTNAASSSGQPSDSPHAPCLPTTAPHGRSAPGSTRGPASAASATGTAWERTPCTRRGGRHGRRWIAQAANRSDLLDSRPPSQPRGHVWRVRRAVLLTLGFTIRPTLLLRADEVIE